MMNKIKQNKDFWVIIYKDLA